MGKGSSRPNNDRSNSLNPNNPAHQASQVNTSNQGNPNNPTYGSSRCMPPASESTESKQ